MSQLHDACERGDLKKVTSLLSNEECDVNTLNTDGESPLHISCKYSHFEIVELLQESRKCDLSIQDNKGNTPLHLACKRKSLDIIKFLLDMRCSTNIPNKKGETAQDIPLNEDEDCLLHIACQWGDVGIVRHLITDGRRDPTIRNMHLNTPLHIACYSKAVSIIRFLLKMRCSTNIPNKKGQTAQDIPLNENGDRLLHIACQWADVNTVNYLINDQKCDRNIQNAKFNTPLHIACLWRSLSITRVLLEQKCSINIPNKKGVTAQYIPLNDNGDLLLHIACQWGDVDIVRYLIIDEKCDINLQNAKFNTPLHFACYQKLLDIIKILLEMRCSTRIPNKKGETAQDIPLYGDYLLHIACQWGDMEIVRYLITDEKCNPNVQNSASGNTPLHTAAKYGQNDIIVQLLLSKECNPNFQNKDGDTALHTAAKYGQDDTIVQLLSCKECDITAQNKDGNTPLHIAVRYNITPAISKLLTNKQCNPNVENKDGNTPLHTAARYGQEDTIVQLVSCRTCNPNVQNKDRLTPLLTAIKHNNSSVAAAVLQHRECDPTLCDSHGNTPLHLACISGETQPEMVELAKQLLTSVDPSCVNNAGQTPMELTTSYQLIQAISHFVKCKTKHSVQTYINMFVVGNPETGKSTLVKAICEEASIFRKFVPKKMRRVKNVPLHTAGIIPTTFRSKTFGNTVLYDLAGQVEYYTSHAAVIRSTVISTPPAFIVVVNLSESEEKIIQTLRYWWSFIDNHAVQSSAPPQVILVGSHADVVRSTGKSVKEKVTHISALLKKLPASFHFAGLVTLDTRDPASRELRHFCSLVNQSYTVLRETADVDLRCHVLYAFLLDRFSGKVACTVSDVATCVKENRELLPQSPSNLIPLISTLSDKGLLLLVKGSESHGDCWIILQKQALLRKVIGAIFAPKNFRQYKDLSWSTGVVPFSKLKNEFPDYNPNMVFGFLTHLEFCFKVKDPKTLSLVKDEAANVEDISLNVSEEYYFFPALVSVENPLHVWEENDHMCCKCGWFYQCVRHDQFLTTQFLHVLILRLAFTFALKLDPGDCREDSLSLRRKCSVWKHGIAWLNRAPIETVVEVGLQYQSVIVMMSCPKGREAKCAQLHSEVIQKVLEAKYEHCKAVKMSESFIHPTDVKYPFTDKMEDVKFYSVTEIARGIIYKGDALDRSGLNPIPVQDLLLTDTSRELLRELFSVKHSMDETVRSQVLETLNTTHQSVVIQDVESERIIPLQVAVTKEKPEGRKTVSSQHCTKPTLPELLKFTCTDKRVVNIPVEIAIKYVQFGTFLLDDRNGSRVKIMAHKHLNDAERINIEILKEWLTGRGKQPVTWATLVEVLRDIELSTLAGEIEAVKCPAKTVSKDF